MGNDNTVQKLTFSKNLNSKENFLITDERNAEKNEIIDNINFINKIDFDVLFKLHYNLSLDFNHKLVTEIIQKLLKNEHLLQIQIDNVIEEKSKIIEKFENELKIINEKLIDKNIIKEIQNQINDSKYFLIILLVYTQLNEINNKLNTHKNLINDFSNQQEKLYKIDTSLLENKIQETNDKLEKLKEDFKNEKTIVNNIESINKNYKEGYDYLQKQIDELKNYINRIGEEIIPGIDKKIENLITRIKEIENNPNIINYKTNYISGIIEGNKNYFYDRYGYGYGYGVYMKEGNCFTKWFPLLLIIILICILYILVGIIFWRIKKNKKDCEERIKELEIYFNQTIIKLEEKIDILNNNTNNSQNYKKKIELLNVNDTIKVNNKEEEKNEKEIENQNKKKNENYRNEDYNR